MRGKLSAEFNDEWEGKDARGVKELKGEEEDELVGVRSGVVCEGEEKAEGKEEEEEEGERVVFGARRDDVEEVLVRE